MSGYKAIASSQKRTVKNIVLGSRSSASMPSGQTASSATVVRIPLRLSESLPPLFPQETQGRHNQNKRTAQRMAVKLKLHYG